VPAQQLMSTASSNLVRSIITRQRITCQKVGVEHSSGLRRFGDRRGVFGVFDSSGFARRESSMQIWMAESKPCYTLEIRPTPTQSVPFPCLQYLMYHANRRREITMLSATGIVDTWNDCRYISVDFAHAGPNHASTGSGH
jgi:hypothetical protein